MKSVFPSILLASLLICSCSTRHTENFDSVMFNQELAYIDSINNILIAENSDKIPAVADSDTGMEYNEKEIQNAWRTVKKDWDKFCSLCNRGKYEKAAELLTDVNIQGSVLGHLRQSELRYEFITNILDPLLVEYTDEEEHMFQFLDWRRTEFVTELSLVQAGRRIPEHFPTLIKEVGYGYAYNDDFDQALGMTDILDPVIWSTSQDSMVVELNHYVYMGSIYQIAGDTTMQHQTITFFLDSILPEYEPVGSENYNVIYSALEERIE